MKGTREKYRLAGAERGLQVFVRGTIVAVIIMNWFCRRQSSFERREIWECADRSVMAMDFASL